MAQECKTPIKISGAHADAMVLFIEGDGRRNDEIEILGVDEHAARRLPDTQTILLELRVRRDFAKQHLCSAAQDWNENALVCAPRALDDFACIDFVVHRQVSADQLAGGKLTRFDDAFTDDARRYSPFVGRHRAARRECLRSLFLHRVGHVKSPGRRRRFPPVPLPSRRSRTGATGGVSRGRNRLTVSTALLKCCRQCTTPR